MAVQMPQEVMIVEDDIPVLVVESVLAGLLNEICKDDNDVISLVNIVGYV